jgi:uronate dehydrogenase
MNVLFLGATGTIGRQVVPILKEHFALTLAAKGGGEIDGMPVIDLDISDFEATEALVKAGAVDGHPFDAIVNSAISPHGEADYSSKEGRYIYAEKCIDINARGAYYVFEAAARARVSKVVYISSLTVVMGAPTTDYFDAGRRDTPRGIYGCTKLFGEHVGRYYAYRSEQEGHSFQVLCLRLGQPYRSFKNSDTPEGLRDNRGINVHYEDVAQAIHRALEIDMQYGVFSIISDSDKPKVDPVLYTGLGYKPAWRSTEAGIFPVDSVAVAEIATESHGSTPEQAQTPRAFAT